MKPDLETLLELLAEGAMFDQDDDPDWVDWSNRAILAIQSYGKLTQVIVE